MQNETWAPCSKIRQWTEPWTKHQALVSLRGWVTTQVAVRGSLSAGMWMWRYLFEALMIPEFPFYGDLAHPSSFTDEEGLEEGYWTGD